LFDQSITETLIDYADFQAAKDSKWWRVDGGMQRVAEAMQSHLLSTDWPEPGSRAIKVTTGSPVTALSHDKQAKKMSVTVAGGQAVEYDMVFNTTAMGPLQRMDLHGLGLPDRILTGIRSLSYDRATKVVIRFTKPWWCAAPRPKIYGGVSQTDLPISNVVYPSWNDGPDHPAVLMVSYSWAQDATRMASLVRDYTVVAPEKDDPIVTLCLQNLAMLWKDRIKSADLFKDLSDMYMTHHAWAWENDPYTGGAFALFGPGQFKNLYPNFLRLQCDGRFAMCGEALSAHHAWIAGAFDSVYIKMYQFLVANRRIKDIAKLYSSTWFGAGKDAHSEEMDEFLMKHIVALEFPTRQDGEGSEHQQAIVQGMAK
jgi:monoamine oxidase